MWCGSQPFAQPNTYMPTAWRRRASEPVGHESGSIAALWLSIIVSAFCPGMQTASALRGVSHIRGSSEPSQRKGEWQDFCLSLRATGSSIATSRTRSIVHNEISRSISCVGFWSRALVSMLLCYEYAVLRAEARPDCARGREGAASQAPRSIAQSKASRILRSRCRRKGRTT